MAGALPFMTGIMPVLLALYIRRMLPESPEFEKAKKRGDVEKAPFFSLFKPPALWNFLQVFAFMTGLFLTDYSVYGFLTEHPHPRRQGLRPDHLQPHLWLRPLYGFPGL